MTRLSARVHGPIGALALTAAALGCAAGAGAHAAQPDLRLGSPRPALVRTLHPGAALTIAVPVRNAGGAGSHRTTVAATLSADSTPSRDDRPIGATTVPALHAGRSATARIRGRVPAAATPGHKRVIVCVKPDRAPKTFTLRKPRTPRCLVVPVIIVPSPPVPDGPGGGGDPNASLPWHFKVLDAAMTTHTTADRSASVYQACSAWGLPVHAGQTFSVSTADSGPPNTNVTVSDGAYGLNGAITVRAPGSNTYDLIGCQGFDSGTPITACSTSFSRPLGGDGTQTIGFDFAAPSADAANATLTWYLPPASAGFVDVDDSVCNAENVFQNLTTAQKSQSVPMSTFAQTQPFTLHFTGMLNWTTDQYGKPAQVHHDWDYILVLQRVDAAGNPLP